MTRKIAYVGFPYMIALFFASFLSVKINFVLAGILGIILIISIVRKSKIQVYVIIISAIIALFYNCFYTMFYYNKLLKYDEVTTEISAVVLDANQTSKKGVYYDLEWKNKKLFNPKVKMYSRNGVYKKNDEIKTKVKFSIPKDTIKFDTFKYNKSKGIYLSSLECGKGQVIKTHKRPIITAIENYSNYIYGVITKTLPGDEGGFLGAMLCGDKSELSSESETNLYKAGLGHMIAVSGTHLMIVVGILLLILRLFKTSKRFNFIITEIFIIAFVLFTGMPVSVVRAAIMITILMFGKIIYRTSDPMSAIAFSGIILTLGNPYSISNPSFCLSFSAVFAVAVVAPYFISYLKLDGRFKKTKVTLLTSICVTIFIFPFCTMYFDYASIICPISNLLLAPFCILALVCGVIIAFTGGIFVIAKPLLLISGIALKIVLVASKWLIKIPFAYVITNVKYIEIVFVLSFAFLVFMFVKFKSKKAMFCSGLSCILVIIIIFFINFMQNKDILKINIVYNKNNCALVLNKYSQTCIIDVNGAGKCASVVDDIISEQDAKKIDGLVLLNKPQKALAQYINEINPNINNIFLDDSCKTITNKDINYYFLKQNPKILLNNCCVNCNENIIDLKFDEFDFGIVKEDNNDNFELIMKIIDDKIELTDSFGNVYKFDEDENAVIEIKAKRNGDFVVRRRF